MEALGLVEIADLPGFKNRTAELKYVYRDSDSEVLKEHHGQYSGFVRDKNWDLAKDKFDLMNALAKAVIFKVEIPLRNLTTEFSFRITDTEAAGKLSCVEFGLAVNVGVTSPTFPYTLEEMIIALKEKETDDSFQLPEDMKLAVLSGNHRVRLLQNNPVYANMRFPSVSFYLDLTTDEMVAIDVNANTIDSFRVGEVFPVVLRTGREKVAEALNITFTTPHDWGRAGIRYISKADWKLVLKQIMARFPSFRRQKGSTFRLDDSVSQCLRHIMSVDVATYDSVWKVFLTLWQQGKIILGGRPAGLQEWKKVIFSFIKASVPSNVSDNIARSIVENPNEHDIAFNCLVYLNECADIPEGADYPPAKTAAEYRHWKDNPIKVVRKKVAQPSVLDIPQPVRIYAHETPSEYVKDADLIHFGYLKNLELLLKICLAMEISVELHNHVPTTSTLPTIGRRKGTHYDSIDKLLKTFKNELDDVPEDSDSSENGSSDLEEVPEQTPKKGAKKRVLPGTEDTVVKKAKATEKQITVTTASTKKGKKPFTPIDPMISFFGKNELGGSKHVGPSVYASFDASEFGDATFGKAYYLGVIVREQDGSFSSKLVLKTQSSAKFETIDSLPADRRFYLQDEDFDITSEYCVTVKGKQMSIAKNPRYLLDGTSYLKVEFHLVTPKIVKMVQDLLQQHGH